MKTRGRPDGQYELFATDNRSGAGGKRSSAQESKTGSRLTPRAKEGFDDLREILSGENPVDLLKKRGFKFTGEIIYSHWTTLTAEDRERLIDLGVRTIEDRITRKIKTDPTKTYFNYNDVITETDIPEFFLWKILSINLPDGRRVTAIGKVRRGEQCFFHVLEGNPPIPLDIFKSFPKQ